MNDLLFCLTILALLYYFFIYQPSPKSLTKPLTHSHSTQTDPDPIKFPSAQFQEDNPELESQVDHLIQEIQSLCLKIN